MSYVCLLYIFGCIDLVQGAFDSVWTIFIKIDVSVDERMDV